MQINVRLQPVSSAQRLSSYNKEEKGQWNNWVIISFGQVRDQNKIKWVNMKIVLISFLTPSLPQPVKFPGWQMPTYACKQHIWWSYNKSTFNTVRSDRNPFTCSCKRRKKTLIISRLVILLVVFSESTALKGLIISCNVIWASCLYWFCCTTIYWHYITTFSNIF